MPQALVSSLNNDVVQGFLQGFQHAATLIQSRQQQEAENQREQARLAQQEKQHQDTIKNKWAMEAMRLGTAAEKFKQQTAQGKIDAMNADRYNAARNVLENERTNLESYLTKNEDYITNAKDFRKNIKDINARIMGLATIKPGPDGIYQDKDLAQYSTLPDRPEPKFTPEYQQKVQLDIDKEAAQIDKMRRSGTAGDEKAKAKASASFMKMRSDFNAQYNAAEGIYPEAFRDAYAKVIKDNPNITSEEAAAKANQVIYEHPLYGKYYTAATEKLAPFVQKISDPNYVDSTEFPDLHQLTVSAMSNPQFDYLRTPRGYVKWTNYLAKGSNNPAIDDDSKASFAQMLGIVNGTISPTPQGAALKEFYDQQPTTDQQEGGGGE